MMMTPIPAITKIAHAGRNGEELAAMEKLLTSDQLLEIEAESTALTRQ